MVGDQSGYVLLISSAMEACTETIRKSMSGTRYFRSYCDKFAARFADRYMAAINTCGQISEVGAEQLLLDAQALKSTLMEMPRMGADKEEGEAEEETGSRKKAPPNASQAVPAAYGKIVTQGVGRIEALLKAILAPSDPPDALVDRFILLFPKTPRETFQQILNIKGVKPADQPAYFRVLQRMVKQAEANTTTTTTAAVSSEELRPSSTSQGTPPAAAAEKKAGSGSGSGSHYLTPDLKGPCGSWDLVVRTIDVEKSKAP
ncbi:Vacuolar protein sorting-associated protein 53 [Coemansia aciculifera]|nr:Vacuolar protein sorting-associated protein 53 [Coemansia aciculifera]